MTRRERIRFAVNTGFCGLGLLCLVAMCTPITEAGSLAWHLTALVGVAACITAAANNPDVWRKPR